MAGKRKTPSEQVVEVHSDEEGLDSVPEIIDESNSDNEGSDSEFAESATGSDSDLSDSDLSDSDLAEDVFLSDGLGSEDELEFESEEDSVERELAIPEKKSSIKRAARPAVVPEIDLVNTEFGVDSSQTDTDSDGDPLHIGNVPHEWYDEYDHIGYTLDGQKIRKAIRGDELDEFLRKMDDPNYWKTVQDPKTRREVVLSDRDIQIVRNIQKGEFATGADQCLEYVDFFSGELMIHPMHDRTSKNSFLEESYDDSKRVAKLVKAIRNGWLVPQNTDQHSNTSKETKQYYDLWAVDETVPNSFLAEHNYVPTRKGDPIIAPKAPLPKHVESYNPAEEFIYEYNRKLALVDQEEQDRIQKGPRNIQDYRNDDYEDRVKALGHKPVRYSSIRNIPAYEDYVTNRFERCLDLYLAPRALKKKKGMHQTKLLPDLPKPKDLEPYPKTAAIFYNGHLAPIRSISIDINGQYLASASDDRTVRIWEIVTGKALAIFTFPQTVTQVAWSTNPEYHFLACVSQRRLFFINPRVSSQRAIATTAKYLDGVFTRNTLISMAADDNPSDNSSDNSSDSEVDVEEGVENEKDTRGNRKNAVAGEKIRKTIAKAVCTWSIISDAHTTDYYTAVYPDPHYDTHYDPHYDTQHDKVHVVEHIAPIADFAWHHRGNYFATVAGNKTIVHQLARAQSQSLFAKSKFQTHKVVFHPFKPIVFLSTQTTVRVYNLQLKRLAKVCRSHSKYISSLAVHPGGDNFIVGTYDKKTSWFDLDYSTKPYKTMRFHKKAVRSVAFHPRHPLFATCSDDAKILVFHSTVYSDFTQNPLIVPLKVLTGHTLAPSGLGILNIQFHPSQPWLFSSAADNTIICHM